MLVIATALLLFAFASVVSILLIQHDREELVRAVQDRNRAFMSAVDAELAGHIARVQQLVALRSVESDDVSEIQRDLHAMLPTQRDWLTLILLTPDGQQVVNAVAPNGVQLPAANEMESLRRTVETMQPSIGNMSRGRLVDGLGIPIRVPVIRDAKVVFILTAVVRQQAFAALLARQQVPDGWVAGIVDAKGQIVARVPPLAPGSLPAQVFLDAIAKSAEGWTRMTTLEGIDNFTAHKTSDFSHWTVSIAIPTSVVLGASQGAALGLAVGVMVTIALGVGIAVVLGRRISRPIGQLAAKAPLLGSGKAAEVPVTQIDEVRQLGEALQSASAAIRVRQELAEQQRQALEAGDRAKDEFIAMLSHELRNPLAALTSASQILAAVRTVNKTVDAVQGVIERQTQQMTRLVEDLLDVSRVATGKITLDKEALDLGELVGGVVRTWQQAGRLADRRLTTTLNEVWVNGDYARLEQVVTNLLHNAVKFTGNGAGITVTVDSLDDHARLGVADEGAGIPAEELSRVFEPFVQAPQGLSRHQGGLGLGLAIVQRLIRLHGGTAHAESEGPNRGSCFTVLLPSIPPSSIHHLRSLHRTSASSVKRVLLVEDNDDARGSMAMLLRVEGFDVEAECDGMSALASCNRALPDLALLDIGLPDIDGYEVARRIRAMPGAQHCILIAVTGYGQPEDVAKALAAGFDHHITKPLTLSALHEALAMMQRGRSAGTAAPTSRHDEPESR